MTSGSFFSTRRTDGSHRTVLSAVPGVLRSDRGPAFCSDENVSTLTMLEVPVRARIRTTLCAGDGFVVVAQVLPDWLGGTCPGRVHDRKLTRRLGPGVVEELNRLLLDIAAETGQLRLDKVRVDTTVVEADIKYPTDSGLLTKAISRIAVLMRLVEKTGMRIDCLDRTIEARHHAHSIGVWLRRRSDEAKAEERVESRRTAG